MTEAPPGRGRTEEGPAVPQRAHSWWQGFAFAGRGLAAAWATERNLRVQCAVGWAALCLAWLLGLSAGRAAAVAGAVAGVLVVEILNTAVEALVDLACPVAHPLAATAKDLAAGAVLCASAAAVAVGAVAFWPVILRPAGAVAAGWAARPAAVAVGIPVEALLVLLACAPMRRRGGSG